MANLKETRLIYKRTDFYYETEILNKTFLGFLNDRNIGLADDDVFIEVSKRHEFRPNVLAFDLYGKDEYAWIFPRMNMDVLIDPIRDLREGLVLRIPTTDRVMAFFT